MARMARAVCPEAIETIEQMREQLAQFTLDSAKFRDELG
jgi:hypothetical protein